MTFNL